MKKNVYTKEHLLYLASVRRKNIAVIFARALILFALLGIWELAARLNWVNPFVTSSPSRVAKTLGELYRAGTLFYHIGVTLSETLIGFFIAVAGGYVLALLLWWSDGVRRTAEPYLVVINALPKIALGPLVIIWFGTGKEAIICMTVLVGIIVATMNMLGGFMETDENKLLLLRSLGADKMQILLKLVVPSSQRKIKRYAGQIEAYVWRLMLKKGLE